MARRLASVPGPAIDRTLIILTCSGRKRPGGSDRVGRGIADFLPDELAAELVRARRAVSAAAHHDESALMPAWRRHAGRFFDAAGGTIGDAVAAGAHLLVLSGGYGVVTADEPIGCYNRAYRLGDWPDYIIERILGKHAKREALDRVVAFASRSTPYATVIRRVQWPDNVASAGLVVADHRGGGGRAVVPRALGEAFRSFSTDGLSDRWRSRDGTTLTVEQLR